MVIDKQTYRQIKELNRQNSPDLIRTFLANERTFLSFIRTALTLLIVGVTFVKFLDHIAYIAIGWAFIPMAVATFAVGLVRYIKLKVIITAFTKNAPEKSPVKHSVHAD